MQQKPADHVVYRPKAALQFTLKAGAPVRIEGQKGVYSGTNTGRLFVVAAEAKGERSYNWTDKVTISLDVNEVGKFLWGLKGIEKCDFYHDRYKGTDQEGTETKQMSISPSQDRKKLFVNVSLRRGELTRQIPGISLGPSDVETLEPLLRAAIPKILGWS